MSEDVNLSVCPFSGTDIIRATYHSDKWLLMRNRILLISESSYTGVRPQSKVARDYTLAPDPGAAPSTLGPDPEAALDPRPAGSC